MILLDKKQFYKLMKDIFPDNIQLKKGDVNEFVKWLYDEMYSGRLSGNDLATLKKMSKRRLLSILFKLTFNKSYIGEVFEFFINEVAIQIKDIQLTEELVTGLIILSKHTQLNKNEKHSVNLQPAGWVCNHLIPILLTLVLPSYVSASGNSSRNHNGVKADAIQLLKIIRIIGNINYWNSSRSPIVNETLENFAVVGAIFQNFLYNQISGKLTVAGRKVAEFIEHHCRIHKMAENYSKGGIIDLIEHSLYAHTGIKNNVDYIVINNRIVLVNQMTGRQEQSKHFGRSLHPFIQAKHGLSIEEPIPTTRTITVQSFFRKVPHLVGMSGTLIHDERELRELYVRKSEESIVVLVPPFITPRINQLSSKFYWDKKNKWKGITIEILNIRAQSKQPILVITSSVKDSNMIAETLQESLKKYNLHLDFNVLNAMTEEEEEAIISFAGQLGAITIATQMAARGTDITVSKDSIEQGGLYVIVSEYHQSLRLDIQSEGRTARHGDPGCSRFFCSLEDDIFKHGKYKSWITKNVFPDETSFVEFTNNSLIASNIRELQLDQIESLRRNRTRHFLVDSIVDPYRMEFYALREHFIIDLNKDAIEGVRFIASIYLEELQNLRQAHSIHQLAQEMARDILVHRKTIKRVTSIYQSQLPFTLEHSSLDRAYNNWKIHEEKFGVVHPKQLSRFILSELLQIANNEDVAYVNKHWNKLIHEYKIDDVFEPTQWYQLYKNLRNNLSLTFGWEDWTQVENVLRKKAISINQEPYGLGEMIRKSIIDVLLEKNYKSLESQVVSMNDKAAKSTAGVTILGVNIFGLDSIGMLDEVVKITLEHFNKDEQFRHEYCKKMVTILDDVWARKLDEVRLAEKQLLSGHNYNSDWAVLLTDLGRLLRNAFEEIADKGMILLATYDASNPNDKMHMDRFLSEESLGSVWALYCSNDNGDMITDSSIEHRLSAYKQEMDLYKKLDTKTEKVGTPVQVLEDFPKPITDNLSPQKIIIEQHAHYWLSRFDCLLAGEESEANTEMTLKVANYLFQNIGCGLTAAKLLETLDNPNISALEYIEIYKAFGCRNQQLNYLELLRSDGALPIHLKLNMTRILVNGNKEERSRAEQILSSESIIHELGDVNASNIQAQRLSLTETLYQLASIQAYDLVLEVFSNTYHILGSYTSCQEQAHDSIQFHMLFRVVAQALRKGSVENHQRFTNKIGLPWREYIENIILGLTLDISADDKLSKSERIDVYSTLLLLACTNRDKDFVAFFGRTLVELIDDNHGWIHVANLFESADFSFESSLCKARFHLIVENFEESIDILNTLKPLEQSLEIQVMRLLAHLGMARILIQNLYGRKQSKIHIKTCETIAFSLLRCHDLKIHSTHLEQILMEALCLKRDYQKVITIAERFSATDSQWYTQACIFKMLKVAKTPEDINRALEEVNAQTPQQYLEKCKALNWWLAHSKEHIPQTWKKELSIIIKRARKKWETLPRTLGNHIGYWELGLLTQSEARLLEEIGDAEAVDRFKEAVTLWKSAINLTFNKTKSNETILKRHEKLVREEIEESLRRCLQNIKQIERANV